MVVLLLSYSLVMWLAVLALMCFVVIVDVGVDVGGCVVIVDNATADIVVVVVVVVVVFVYVIVIIGVVVIRVVFLFLMLLVVFLLLFRCVFGSCVNDGVTGGYVAICFRVLHSMLFMLV